mgnify:CR=1 FL=1
MSNSKVNDAFHVKIPNFYYIDYSKKKFPIQTQMYEGE